MNRKKIGIVGSFIEGAFANLLSVNENYIDIIEKSGNIPIILPVTEDAYVVESLIKNIDCLLLQDGENISSFLYNENPKIKNQNYNMKRDYSEIIYTDTAVKYKKKILGFGRGMHIINVFFEGDLEQSLNNSGFNTIYHINENKEASYHYIDIERDSILFEVFENDKLIVSSKHNQGIENIGEGLKVIAKSEDGLVEGFVGNNTLGVQFDIVSMDKVYGSSLVSKFVESAGVHNE